MCYMRQVHSLCVLVLRIKNLPTKLYSLSDHFEANINNPCTQCVLTGMTSYLVSGGEGFALGATPTGCIPVGDLPLPICSSSWLSPPHIPQHSHIFSQDACLHAYSVRRYLRLVGTAAIANYPGSSFTLICCPCHAFFVISARSIR